MYRVELKGKLGKAVSNLPGEFLMYRVELKDAEYVYYLPVDDSS